MPLAFLPRRRQRAPLRTRRRRARLIAVGSAFLALLITLGGVSYASHTERFTVQSFIVEGATYASPKDIETYAFDAIQKPGFHFFSPSNIFLYGPKKLEKGIIEYFPRIQYADVRREALFANVVYINIEERQPFAVWCRAGTADLTVASSTPRECYFLDETGFIFAPASDSQKSATSYVFGGGIKSDTPIGALFAESHMEGILAFLKLLQENNLTPVGAAVEGDNDFHVPLQNRFYIKASFGANAEDLVRNLTLVLESERLKDRHERLEYVDLRFGNKVYFKLEGAQSSELGTQ